jgi:hypothetical protein
MNQQPEQQSKRRNRKMIRKRKPKSICTIENGHHNFLLDVFHYRGALYVLGQTHKGAVVG